MGSKNKEVNPADNDAGRSSVRTGGSNNIRLPRPLKMPYPNEEIDIQKYLEGQLQEGTVKQPEKEIVPMNLNDMAN